MSRFSSDDANNIFLIAQKMVTRDRGIIK